MKLQELQEYIKSKDHRPELANGYFQKLIEEVGELSKVIRKNKRWDKKSSIKETIEEELSDVLYYTLALANIYDIDLGETFSEKEKVNDEKYNRTTWKTFLEKK